MGEEANGVVLAALHPAVYFSYSPPPQKIFAENQCCLQLIQSDFDTLSIVDPFVLYL